MKRPSRRLENNLRAQGYRAVVGLDEVGRGAWAGPLVGAAVVLDGRTVIPGLRDSKLLTARVRETLYPNIVARARAWSVTVIGVEELNLHGLSWANREAFLRAVRTLSVTADFAVTDGKIDFRLGMPSLALVDADTSVACVAAASILAKVTRDRLMHELHEHYPNYGFDRHVGYGTADHRAALHRHGPSPLHRRGFAPIRSLLDTGGILQTS